LVSGFVHPQAISLSNNGELPKCPSELMRGDPPNCMDLRPLSRLCFGCKLFSTIVFILLLSLSARAEEEEPMCKTVAECRVPKPMTHDEAIDYCNALGGHLPTALELAQLAIKEDGKNIAEPSDAHDLSYKPVDARNPDNSLDHFLFSYRNYPYGVLTQGSPVSRIWSSSAWSKGSDPETGYFYALRDGEGSFVPEKKDNQYAVFCVQ
jgi:hypothetical protein